MPRCRDTAPTFDNFSSFHLIKVEHVKWLTLLKWNRHSIDPKPKLPPSIRKVRLAAAGLSVLIMRPHISKINTAFVASGAFAHHRRHLFSFNCSTCINKPCRQVCCLINFSYLRAVRIYSIKTEFRAIFFCKPILLKKAFKAARHPGVTLKFSKMQWPSSSSFVRVVKSVTVLFVLFVLCVNVYLC